jgi:hypothetical protein
MQSGVNAIKRTGDYKCHIWPHIYWIIILENTWLKFDVFYFIDDIKLLMLKLVSNKIDTYLTSLWRHERYLFSVFRGILPAVFRRFSKKLSTSVVVLQKIFYQLIKINKTQILLNVLFWCTRCWISWKTTGKCSNITSASVTSWCFRSNLCRKKRWYVGT